MDMHSRVREYMTTYHAAQIPDKGHLSNGALFDTMNLSKLQNPRIDRQFSEDYPRKYTGTYVSEWTIYGDFWKWYDLY